MDARTLLIRRVKNNNNARCICVCVCVIQYSKADSRYATYDPFVLAMETVTAFIDGPLCIVTAAAIMRESKYRSVRPLCPSTCASVSSSSVCLMRITEMMAWRLTHTDDDGRYVVGGCYCH